VSRVFLQTVATIATLAGMALLGESSRANAGFISLADPEAISSSMADRDDLAISQQSPQVETPSSPLEWACQSSAQTGQAGSANASNNGGSSANVPAALLPGWEGEPLLRCEFLRVLHEPSLPDPTLSSIFHPPRCA